MKIIAICLLFLLFSCSNNSTQIKTVNTEKSLRSLSVDFENSVEWVDGIEIVKNEDSTQTLITESSTTIDYALHTIDTKNIYPTLQDFTSLDTETIPSQLYSTLKEFLNTIKTNSINTEKFSKNHQYLKALTEYNLQDYPALQSYIIGKAIKSNGTYEIPTRLVFENQYANCKIYWKIEDSAYKIVQIDIGVLKDE